VGLREILAPKDEASKVSLRGRAHAQSASQGLVGSGSQGEKS